MDASGTAAPNTPPSRRRTASGGEKLGRNRERDADTDRLLTAAGWLPLRIWDHEVPELAAKAIADVVRDRMQ